MTEPVVVITVNLKSARSRTLGPEPLPDLRPDERWSWSDGLEDPGVSTALALPDPCQETRVVEGLVAVFEQDHSPNIQPRGRVHRRRRDQDDSVSRRGYTGSG
jgi:hypothetical protein